MNVEYHQYHGGCRLEYDPGGRLCPKDVADDHLGVSKQEMNNVWFSMKALKCKTLGGILRCRLTNALSRQLALLAEPKNPLDSTMSTSSGFFVHTMKHCYATALYTTEAQALSITHARISLPHACNHERSIRKECGK